MTVQSKKMRFWAYFFNLYIGVILQQGNISAEANHPILLKTA
jgi:hypothetical protein